MSLLISRSLDHDHNETEDAFDTRLITVTHEASMDIWTTNAPETVIVVKTFPSIFTCVVSARVGVAVGVGGEREREREREYFAAVSAFFGSKVKNYV